MATVNVNIHVRGDERIRDEQYEDGSIALAIEAGPLSPESPVLIHLPFDDEDALLVTDLFAAALDNARSRVEARRLRRDHWGRLAGGLDGAGADVEAYRG